MRITRPFRSGMKTYWLIGPCQFQYGHLSHSLGVWIVWRRFRFGVKWFTLWKGIATGESHTR